MDTRISTLSTDNIGDVKKILLDSFGSNPYYASIFPDKSTRLKELSKVTFPPMEYCVESKSALGAFCGENLCGFALIAEYSKKSAVFVERLFFDLAISAGDHCYSMKDELMKAKEHYGSVAYLYLTAIDESFRGMGIGRKLNRHVLDSYKHMPVMTELTSPAIISVYKGFESEMEIKWNHITDCCAITTVMPRIYS